MIFRCISDHGREARFPFLDEEVVSFLNSLPVWIKVECKTYFFGIGLLMSLVCECKSVK